VAVNEESQAVTPSMDRQGLREGATAKRDRPRKSRRVERTQLLRLKLSAPSLCEESSLPAAGRCQVDGRGAARIQAKKCSLCRYLMLRRCRFSTTTAAAPAVSVVVPAVRIAAVVPGVGSVRIASVGVPVGIAIVGSSSEAAENRSSRKCAHAPTPTAMAPAITPSRVGGAGGCSSRTAARTHRVAEPMPPIIGALVVRTFPQGPSRTSLIRAKLTLIRCILRPYEPAETVERFECAAGNLPSLATSISAEQRAGTLLSVEVVGLDRRRRSPE
jgi:hypothetical protein